MVFMLLFKETCTVLFAMIFVVLRNGIFIEKYTAHTGLSIVGCRRIFIEAYAGIFISSCHEKFIQKYARIFISSCHEHVIQKYAGIFIRS